MITAGATPTPKTIDQRRVALTSPQVKTLQTDNAGTLTPHHHIIAGLSMPQPQHEHAQIAPSRAPIPTGQRAPLQEQRDPPA